MLFVCCHHRCSNCCLILSGSARKCAALSVHKNWICQGWKNYWSVTCCLILIYPRFTLFKWYLLRMMACWSMYRHCKIWQLRLSTFLYGLSQLICELGCFCCAFICCLMKIQRVSCMFRIQISVVLSSVASSQDIFAFNVIPCVHKL